MPSRQPWCHIGIRPRRTRRPGSERLLECDRDRRRAPQSPRHSHFREMARDPRRVLAAPGWASVGIHGDETRASSSTVQHKKTPASGSRRNAARTLPQSVSSRKDLRRFFVARLADASNRSARGKAMWSAPGLFRRHWAFAPSLAGHRRGSAAARDLGLSLHQLLPPQPRRRPRDTGAAIGCPILVFGPDTERGSRVASCGACAALTGAFVLCPRRAGCPPCVDHQPPGRECCDRRGASPGSRTGHH